MSNYPPGVTGNEPQITGEWPCGYCGGTGGNKEDGSCELCKGKGIHPEESFEMNELLQRMNKWLDQNTDLGKWEIEERDGYINISTNLQVFGEWLREED